jgi:hypothetical protein
VTRFTPLPGDLPKCAGGKKRLADGELLPRRLEFGLFGPQNPRPALGQHRITLILSSRLLCRAESPSGHWAGQCAFQSVKNRTETGQTTFFEIVFGQSLSLKKRIKPLILLMF